MMFSQKQNAQARWPIIQKPPAPFDVFVRANRKEVTSKHPELDYGQICKKLAEMYKSLS